MGSIQWLINMFTAALFIMAKTQKQLKYPSTDEQVNQVWYFMQRNITKKEKSNEVLLYHEPSKHGKKPDTKRLYIVKFHLYKCSELADL